MQHRSYLLLKWIAKAVTDGFIRFDAGHTFSTFPEAAKAWILCHYVNIPSNARPPHEDLSAFCAFFSTFLLNSFDLVSDPGTQRYSPGAHCFCPMCSWLTRAPNLKTKRVQPNDKRHAQTMRKNVLLRIAAEHRLNRNENDVEALLNDAQTFADASLVAYGYDLLQREKGIANGPAVLSLWRSFAWTKSGSPQHDFQLKAEMITAAEARLIALMQEPPMENAPGARRRNDKR